MSDKAVRFLALAAAITAIDMLYNVMAEGGLSPSSALSGIMLSALLAWLLTKIRLRRLHALTLTWVTLYVIMFLSNVVEAYFFTAIFNRVEVLVAAITMPIFVTFAEAASAAAILPSGDNSLLELLKNHFSSRSIRAWRVIGAAMAYLPVYFLIGMLIYPFVAEYYSGVYSGLRVPGFELIVPLEVFRGFLYVAALLPIIASLRGDPKSSFIAAFLTLFTRFSTALSSRGCSQAGEPAGNDLMKAARVTFGGSL